MFWRFIGGLFVQTLAELGHRDAINRPQYPDQLLVFSNSLEIGLLAVSEAWYQGLT